MSTAPHAPHMASLLAAVCLVTAAGAQRAPEAPVEVPRAVGEALLAHAARVEIHRPEGSGWTNTLYAVGSGVVCRGVLLTNNHVAGDGVLRGLVNDDDYGRVKAAPRLRLLRPDGSVIALRGLGFIKEAFGDDAAAIAIAVPAGAGIDAFVRFEDLTIGAPVYTMGNSWHERFLVRRGRILRLPERRRSIDDARLLSTIESVMQDDRAGRAGLSRNRYERIVITTDISQPGFSGGPVLDRHGRLVGLIIGGDDDDSRWSGDPRDRTYVLPIDAVFRAVGHRSTPATTPVHQTATRLPGTAASSSPPAVAEPTTQPPPIARPESYPVARARLLEQGALAPNVRAWSLNVRVAEIAAVDEVRWGEGEGAEVVPLVIGAASAEVPTPPSGTAIACLWTGADPALVVLAVGGSENSKDIRPSAEFSLLSKGKKVWHVLPAE